MWSAHPVAVVHISPPIDICGTKISLHALDLSPEDITVEQVAERIDVERYLKPEVKVYHEVSMFVYVVDSAATEEALQVDKELLRKLRELHPASSLLVFANKQDKQGQARKSTEICERLALSPPDADQFRAAQQAYIEGLWYVQGGSCVPPDNHGILSGLEWLVQSAEQTWAWDSD